VKRLCAALACLATAAFGREGAAWTAARSAHFDVYTNAGSEAARSLAGGLERLHSFFVVQTGLAPRREIRVIAFATPQEYARYRTRATADAFYLGAEERDYIVLPAPARGELRVPAHEYAHVLMHSGGWKLPEWIAEGGRAGSAATWRGARQRCGMRGGCRWRSFSFAGRTTRYAASCSMRRVGRWRTC
jgi:hypothetical protein